MINVAKGERVLVTGATGSLGNALIPELLAAGARVRCLSRDEKKQLDLRRRWPDVDCQLGDVRDEHAVYFAMLGVDVVIHAASLKYVDVSERQPTEYVRTNVLGTMNVLHAAQTSDTVRRVVGISTDKVPHAVNVYGLTKALLEKLFVEAHLNRGQHLLLDRDGRQTRNPDIALRAREPNAECTFAVARYGNVIGSRGSVVPFWADQRRRGEPLTVTDPAMTRFFFTLDDAVKLVDVALAAPSGTVVAQPMPAATLGQLARVMSIYSHVEADHACDINCARCFKIVGRRPGEKVHEELLTAEEMARTWSYGDHYEYSPLLDPPYYDDAMGPLAYTSDRAPRLTDDALRAMLKPWLA